MAQHTEETGQRFSPVAVETVWTQTPGPAVAGERAVRGGVL